MAQPLAKQTVRYVSLEKRGAQGLLY